MSTSVSSNKKALIQWIVCVAVTAIIMLIPASESFNAQIKLFLAVTIFSILIFAFDLLPAYVIGFLLPTLWVITGCATWAQAMSGWNSSLVVLLLTSLVFVKMLERIGLMNRIGYKIIVACGGTFKGTIWGLFFASIAVCYITMGNSPVIIAALGLTIFKTFDLTVDDFESIVIMAAVILGGIHSTAISYSPASVGLITASVRPYVPEFTLTWADLMLHNMPILLFMIFCLWTVLKYYEKKHVKAGLKGTAGRDYFKGELEKMGSMTTDEKKACFFLLLVVAGLVLGSLKKIDMAYIFFFTVMLMYMPIIGVGSEKDIHASFGMLPFLAISFAFFAIGTVGNACGFTPFFLAKFLPIMQSLSPIESIYAVLGIGTLSNFVLTPTAMAVLLPGPIVSLCQEAGISYMPHIYAIYTTEHAIFHPYEWPAYMMVFSFGFCKMNNFIKFCCYKTTMFLVFLCVVMVPFWLWVCA